MKPLRRRLNDQAKETGLRLDTIPQDYLLTQVLHSIATSSSLSSTLLFKGGTALKKCYFGNYRFSEDLDFTALSPAPEGRELELAVQECCDRVTASLQEYEPIALLCERYVERQPHPDDQEAFVIRAQFPWQREPLTRVMVEITRDEEVVFEPESRKLIHPYEEVKQADVVCYSLDEIVLEKLRAILQHTKKLHERDWSRSRARDYYDLWHILCGGGKSTSLAEELRLKCASKEVAFADAADFFDPKMVAHVKHHWLQWLQPLVIDLPSVDQVLEELYPVVGMVVG